MIFQEKKGELDEVLSEIGANTIFSFIYQGIINPLNTKNNCFNLIVKKILKKKY